MLFCYVRNRNENGRGREARGGEGKQTMSLPLRYPRTLVVVVTGASSGIDQWLVHGTVKRNTG